MTAAQQAVDAATAEVERIRGRLGKRRDAQIRSADERALLKATALAWFNNHRPLLLAAVGDDQLRPVDLEFQEILALAARAPSRPKCLVRLKNARQNLVAIAANHVVALAGGGAATKSADAAPSFAPLIPDLAMQDILGSRWSECVVCIGAGAPLAATVMIGGLLEGLLLARINRETNKASIFKSAAAPKDRTSGQALPLKEWTLKNYLDVAHEMQWISQSAKDVGEVLRDYRNYIHPQKELTHGVKLRAADAQMLWEIAKSIATQVISSVP